MMCLLLRHLLKLSTILLLLSICKTSHSEEIQPGLPFCGFSESSSKYIFVSTLDGRVTALNPEQGGSVAWSIHPGSEPMLSSSIHKLELTNYGHLVRMIPSLSGGLYKFNGENIEAIPVTADNLLQASFRYSDDLVISGGKESHTFGVSLQSGKILYECSMKGCENDSHTETPETGDILVIQRLGQVVRAVEPRSGSERWNFSVAQHDLKLLSECHVQLNQKVDYVLKVIVPEGLVCAVNKKNPSEVLWKHKFTSPVVSAWQMQKGKLTDIDLFSGTQTGPPDDIVVSPSLYIGMHDKQLYIQESVTMQRKRQEIASKFGQHLITNENNFPRIPWKPISVTSNSMGLIEGKKAEDETTDDATKTTALSVLYASTYVDGNGFYLYSEEDLEKSENALCNVSIQSEKDVNFTDNEIPTEEEETPVQIVIVSLWYWWREVVVISLTTAIVFNLMFTRRFLLWRSKESAVLIPHHTPSSSKETDSGVGLERVRTESESHLPLDFTSRYMTDFDPVDCLGRGGFGVVFEAKNKIDDCHYAIKRIILPDSQKSRERVMREVKALAQLDHHNIVRYFNAWTECPPPGWQENQDNFWLRNHCSPDMFSTSGATSEQNSHIPNKKELTSACSESDSTYSYSRSPREKLNHINGLEQNSVSDSFIVFASNTGSGLINGEEDSGKQQSVINVPVDDESEKGEDECIKSNGCVSSKLVRPNCFTSDFKPSPVILEQSRVYLYIQMQLCQRQSLKEWLTINKNRDCQYVLKIFEQILQAVEYVHLRGLIHRDLKPSNIFFSLDNQIKVGDFGLVTAMTEGDDRMSPCENLKVNSSKEKHTAQVGTQLYMSPEQLSNKPYNYKVDIYSLGLILFELLVPFGTEMERIKVLQNIKDSIFTECFQKSYPNEYELLKLMLSTSPEERPTTYGIRSKPPFLQTTPDQAWHFELPMRRRGSSKSSHLSTSSSEGNLDTR